MTLHLLPSAHSLGRRAHHLCRRPFTLARTALPLLILLLSSAIIAVVVIIYNPVTRASKFTTPVSNPSTTCPPSPAAICTGLRLCSPAVSTTTTTTDPATFPATPLESEGTNPLSSPADFKP